MEEAGIGIFRNPTKSVFDLHARGAAFDFVITFCSKEAAESCPILPGKLIRIHWLLENPSSFRGSDQEISILIRSIRNEIGKAVRELVAERG